MESDQLKEILKELKKIKIKSKCEILLTVLSILVTILVIIGCGFSVFVYMEEIQKNIVTISASKGTVYGRGKITF